MRRLAFAILCLLAVPAATSAAPAGYTEAKRDFDAMPDGLRQMTQVWLIAGGDTNAVPTEHFTTRTFKALQQFEVENGFAPTGRLDAAQVDRLNAVAQPKLDLWGLRKVTFPGSPATIWVPFGLGLETKTTGTGLHYKDEQSRLWLDFVSVRDKTITQVYQELLAEKARQSATIHFEVMKDGWFVVSATTPDGHDHYYRYHQDGDAVTGFALEWDNAAGNINAERIAVLDSAVLGASMKGEPFMDPPDGAPAPQASAAPPPPPEPPVVAQPAAVPVAPVPPPPPKATASTGTGFFVADGGTFLTNAHVVADCATIKVKTDDGALNDATRVATDTSNDLALLKLAKKPARVAQLRIGGRLGEAVEAFGFPHSDVLASSGNFTLGNITAMSGLQDDSRYLQISAPVQTGNSGGPLLDANGNLVGVVTSKLNAIQMAKADGDLPQNVNFAVKSDIVATFLDANRVAFKLGVPGKPQDPADIADQARAMSGFVSCQ